MNFKRMTLLSALCLLTACAGPDAFRVGQKHMDERNWEAAVVTLSQVVKANPSNREYQYALRRSMDEAVMQLMGQAALLADKQPAKALEIYNKVLLLSPNNDRAAEQIKAVEYAQNTKRLFQDASQAAAVGRDQEARTKFQKILSENPSHTEARLALTKLDAKIGKSGAAALLNEALLQPVNITFRDASIRVVFDALTVTHKINFVFDRDLRDDAKTSLTLKDVPFSDAFEQILNANGLSKKVVNNNTFFIYQSTPQKLREHQDLILRSFFVENADVKQLSALLKTVLKIRDIHTDEKRNLIVIRDTPQQIALSEKVIAAHDQSEPEVMLDVEIVEFDHKLIESLGLQFPTQIGFGVASPQTLSALNSLNSSGINVTGLSSLLQLNLQSQTGMTKVLANPRIRIRNREKAKFHVGDKVPVITTTSYPGTLSGATTSAVSYLDVGIKLEFEPIIQLDDQIVIKSSMEDSSITNTVTNNGTTAYQIGTRNVSTTLTLRDGETQVLAGLIRTDEQNTTNQLPGLSQIPGFGVLFRNPSNTNNKKEILLSITPRVVRNIHRPTDDLLSINAGPDAQSQPQGALGNSNMPTQPPRPVTPPAPVQTRPLTPVPNSPAAPTAPPMLTPMVPFGQPSQTATPAMAPGSVATPAAAPGVAAPAPAPAPSATPGLPVFDMPPGVGMRN